MVLFQTKGRLGVENDKSNIFHSFYVPNGIQELRISYSYSPKSVENTQKAVEFISNCFEKFEGIVPNTPSEYLPVNNLLTLSLDDPFDYRGAAHRQIPVQTHIINDEFASPGFVAGEIYQGDWTIVINIHFIGCDVDYQLEVDGFEQKGGNE